MRYDESDMHGEVVHVLACKETIQGGVRHMHARECDCLCPSACQSVSLSVYNNLVNLLTLND